MMVLVMVMMMPRRESTVRAPGSYFGKMVAVWKIVETMLYHTVLSSFQDLR